MSSIPFLLIVLLLHVVFSCFSSPSSSFSRHADRRGDPHRLSEQHQGVQGQLLQRELRLPQQPEHNLLRLRQQFHVAHKDSGQLQICDRTQLALVSATLFIQGCTLLHITASLQNARNNDKCCCSFFYLLLIRL